MTITDQLHKSRGHREGFDTNCPKCLTEYGIAGVISDLKRCERQNRKDAADHGKNHLINAQIGVQAIADEQKRMIGVLQLLLKVTK